MADRLDDALAIDVAVLKHIYADVFRDAFREALGALSPRDRSLLRFHYLDGLGVAEMGRLHRVHTATAARWLERCREALYEGTREALRRRIDVSSSEFESLARLVLSEIEVNLREAAG